MNPEFARPDLRVPQRADLINRLSRANQFAWTWILIQLLAAFGIAFLINWQAVINEPLLSIVAIGVMVGPFMMEILRFWGQNKKEIGNLKEETRFGEFDKHRLRMLQRDTLRRLGLHDEHIRVYVTADKTLNASALRLGLGSLFKSLNGIYLNRQLLHHLEPEEVQDIMGHELGHYYRYYLIGDRFRALTLVLGGLVGLFVAQLTGMASFFSLIISFACASGFWTLAGLQWAKYGATIEYLCDDLGAQVHGVHVSINGLLKLGVEAEMSMAIHNYALRSQLDSNLSGRDIVEAVQAGIPYGKVSQEELEKSVERSLKQRAVKEQELSLSGFFKYVWQSDVDDDTEELLRDQLRGYDQLQKLPRLDWESLLRDRSEVYFSEFDVEKLVRLMDDHPDQLLFRIPHQADDVHPPLRDRILYLWHNRHEIERARLGQMR